MVKTFDAEKQRHYTERIRHYEITINKLLKTETEVIADCRRSPNIAAAKLFHLANSMLDLTSNYIVINGISVAVLNNRNEEALSEAKKSLSKAIIYLENVVTGKVDALYSDYEENLAELSQVSCAERLTIIKKTGLTLDMIENAFGDHSKWRWSFVDIEGRFTAIAKNLLDLKRAQSNNDPSSPDYKPLLYHIRLVKQLLSKSAGRFHERFELATKRGDDIQSALNFLNALRRIHLLMNEKNEVELLKKKIESWSKQLEALPRK